MNEKDRAIIIDGQDITERVIDCQLIQKPDRLPVRDGYIDGLMNTEVRLLLSEGIDPFELVGKSFPATIRWKDVVIDDRWILSNVSTAVSLILKPSGN